VPARKDWRKIYLFCSEQEQKRLSARIPPQAQHGKRSQEDGLRRGLLVSAPHSKHGTIGRKDMNKA